MVRRSTLIFFTCVAMLLAGPSTYPKERIVIAQTPSVLVAQSSPNSELYIGSRGAAVRTLQEQLKGLGLYAGTLDGIFGLATQKAVLAFQSEADVKQTGRLGETTRQALRLASIAGGATDSNSAPVVSEFDTTEPSVNTSDIDEATSNTAISETPDRDKNSQTKEETENRFGKLLTVGLGLSAVAGSFGVGFFVASRGKQAIDLPTADSWPTMSDTTAPNATDPLLAHTNPAIASSLVVSSDLDSHQLDQVSRMHPLDPNEMIGGLIQSLHTAAPQHRRKLIWELGQRGHSLAVQPLVDLMAQTDSKEKSLILAALSEMSVRSLRPMSQALTIALQDDKPEVRKNAIRDLSRIHDLVAQASHLLYRAIEDDDSEVRQTAKWALEQLARIRQPQDFETDRQTLSDSSTASIGSNTVEFEASGSNGSRSRL